MEKTATLHRETLVDTRLTDRFNGLRSTLTGPAEWRAHGFTILLVVEDSCAVPAGGERIALQQYDRIVVPHGMAPLQIAPDQKVVLLECLPPGTEIGSSAASGCKPPSAGKACVPPGG